MLTVGITHTRLSALEIEHLMDDFLDDGFELTQFKFERTELLFLGDRLEIHRLSTDVHVQLDRTLVLGVLVETYPPRYQQDHTMMDGRNTLFTFGEEIDETDADFTVCVGVEGIAVLVGDVALLGIHVRGLGVIFDLGKETVRTWTA